MADKVVRFENCARADDEPILSLGKSTSQVEQANGQSSSLDVLGSIETLSVTESHGRWKGLTTRIRTALAVKNAVKPARTRRRSLWRAPTETVDPFIQKFSTRSDRKTTPPKRKSSHKPQNRNAAEKDNLSTVVELDSKELESDCTSVYEYDTSWSAVLKEIPTVIAPDGRFMYIWFYFVVFAIRYNLWVVILRIAFPAAQDEFTVAWLVFDYFCDFLYVLDIIINFRTGFLEEGILVVDAKRVARHYAVSKNFIADLLSVFPTDILCVLYPERLPMLRINRLIKAYKSFRIKSLMESHTTYPTFLRVFFLLHLMFLLINWNAGFYIMISRTEGFGTNAWVYPGNGSLYQQYLKSLYWSTLTLTAIGDLPSPATNFEYLYTIACYLCGVFMFATIVGNAGSIIVNRNANRLDFERQREGTNNYMRKNRVPKDLQRRVLMWYDYSWARGRIGSGGGDLNSLTLLPDKLKTEIALHVNLETLRKVTFLQKCQPEFLHDLVLMMKLRIFTPGDFICRKGEVAREMYVIIDGKIEVVGEVGQVLKVLSGGDFFGEIGILSLSEGQNRRTADIRTIGYVECFVLSKEDVLKATRDYPEAQAVLAEYGRRRLQGQSTCKDPRLVDMEDCGRDSAQRNKNEEGGSQQWPHTCTPTSDATNGLPASLSLPTVIHTSARSRSSSSSSASLLTPIPTSSIALQYHESRANTPRIDTPRADMHYGAEEQGSQKIDSISSRRDSTTTAGTHLFSPYPSQTLESPLTGYGGTRRSSRAGLLDPLPQRRASYAGITKDQSELVSLRLPKEGPDMTSSDINSSIVRLLTASCGEVVSKVKGLMEKEMQNRIDSLSRELQELRGELTEKNDKINTLKGQISLQETDLSAWRRAVQELEREGQRRTEEMRNLKEEILILKDQVKESPSTKTRKTRPRTTISMTSLLHDDET
ncbi:cGMP-gated cation channel alpha-1 isoform X2 [Nematostella vectensis]|uniref:cGMP-gated cation channel alpha-1 isoform X2 n=1 Tax=Nematostella vectensis TaxID=45351 RepID=UPI0020777BC6|nr:cGMP-gated cation channel alpha-1 isoform X2 [Nematostella vectensis]